MQTIDSATIEKAFTAIEKEKLAPDGKVSSEVMGYISSFGAAVIQAGLEAAVIFFSESSSDKDAKDRPKIMLALHHMMGGEEASLLAYIRANRNDLDTIEERLLDNAVALKMALRTFEKTKTKPNNRH